MIEDWIQTSAGWLALAALLLVVGGWSFAHSRATLRLCPGPARGWRGWLHPRSWLVALGFGTRLGRGCRYDLTGLRPDATGAIRCPECGRILHTDRQTLRTDTQTWPRRLCVLLLLLASVAWLWVDVRVGRWVHRLPTLAVVTTRHALGRDAPPELKAEWWRRLRNDQVDPLSARLLNGWLVEDLRNDQQWGNASSAMEALEMLGPRAIPALEHALTDPDRQKRHMAAMTLQRIDAYTNPSPTFLKVCVEALENDYEPMFNRSSACFYLTDRLPPGADALLDPLLADATRSSDPQQRLLSACIAGWRARANLLPYAAPVLIDAMRDNDVEGDARVALPALFRFGDPVRPYLEPLTNDLDQQLADSCKLILLRLDGVTADGPDKHLIWRLNHVTHGEIDPTEYTSFYHLPW